MQDRSENRGGTWRPVSRQSVALGGFCSALAAGVQGPYYRGNRVGRRIAEGEELLTLDAEYASLRP